MLESFLQLWLMSARDIFGISDERRPGRNRLPPKLNIDQIFADGRRQRKAFMVFMIRYSSELLLNPFLKSIFGLPNAAYAPSRPRRRLSAATKLLKKRLNLKGERRPNVVPRRRRRLGTSQPEQPEAIWRSLQMEPLDWEPRAAAQRRNS